MNRVRIIKTALVAGWAVGVLLWSNPPSLSQPASTESAEARLVAEGIYSPDDYVGSETCQACHDDQFKSFSKTAHARLTTLEDWKEKMQGCESCHGPGREHVEAGGDKTKIRTFQNEGPKQIAETCLSCHAGKEEHNNYRRGEHWRNDVGCVDCHSPHLTEFARPRTESVSFRAETFGLRMLKKNEPQLCLDCHNETKSQFTLPFHHKVLEGAMKCSDCHNPHGGFELKQTRLATGADATCMKCHSDKQGPFVFEHAPLKVEGCAVCHSPHGSSNPRLLKRSQVRQLCLECHSNAHEIGAPNTPSFHNQATVRFQNCTSCHIKIHGSQTSPFFFR